MQNNNKRLSRTARATSTLAQVYSVPRRKPGRTADRYGCCIKFGEQNRAENAGNGVLFEQTAVK